MTTHDYKTIASIVGEDKIDALRKAGVEIAEKPTKPTTGLFGRWAKHEEYGDVLAIKDKAVNGSVGISYLDANFDGDVAFRTVPVSDLSFPEETTRPEDVPVGEAWLVNVDDEEASAEGVVALKRTKTYWDTELVSGNAGSTGDWFNGEVTLIAPLAPVRPTEPETVAMEKEYAALPAGSVVAATGMQPWTKSPMGRFVQGGYIRTITELAGAPRQILRWGWGE